MTSSICQIDQPKAATPRQRHRYASKDAAKQKHSTFLASGHLLYFDFLFETTFLNQLTKKSHTEIHKHGRQLITQGALGQGVQDDSSHARVVPQG
jgi:hypothetical protein